jgi:hypothetical protein
LKNQGTLDAHTSHKKGHILSGKGCFGINVFESDFVFAFFLWNLKGQFDIIPKGPDSTGDASLFELLIKIIKVKIGLSHGFTGEIGHQTVIVGLTDQKFVFDFDVLLHMTFLMVI